MSIVRELSRRLTNALWTYPLEGPFRTEGGHAYSVNLPDLVHLADKPGEPVGSTLVLYENETPLVLPHAPRDEVRSMGGGRYSHWREKLVFSTSDNSDPNVNGRAYCISLASWLFRRRVGTHRSNLPEMSYPTDHATASAVEESKPTAATVDNAPVNYRKLTATPEQIEADVDYAVRIGENYRRKLHEYFPQRSLVGQRILEIGPGINDGSVVYLSTFGAKPMVVDRFLSRWDDDYHPAFYQRLQAKVLDQRPEADCQVIARILQSAATDPRAIERFETPLEQLALPNGSVDIVLSNAVGEHLYDPLASMKSLARVTKPGGVGLHQVDHRDHRDFSRPLEYLVMSDHEFKVMADAAHMECGNRYRASEMQAMIRQAGFELVNYESNMTIAPEYLDDVLPRLRNAPATRYRDWPTDDLHSISGLYIVVKPR